MNIASIGIDLDKTTFHLVALGVPHLFETTKLTALT
jgi:hypothetical protein